MHLRTLLSFIIPVLLVITSKNCFAQSATFGQVPLEALTSQYYDRDSTASAVILSDIGKSYFEYTDQFRIRHVRHVRIKIYNKQGLDWANVAVPYYTKDIRDIEIIKDIEAATYNIKDGVIVKKELDKRSVYDNKISNKWSEKVFALPDVKEGSVIEYRYTVVSPFLFNLRDWQFQYEIPVKWTEYEVKIPAFYEYQMLYQGFQAMEINESEVLRGKEKLGGYDYQTVRCKWALKDVPSFQDENFITTEDDYIAKMNFQLSKVNYPGQLVKEYMTTWPKLIQDFLQLSDFGKNLKKKDGEETVAMLTKNLSSDMEKVHAIYRYVNSSLAWNGKNSIYPSKSPKKVLEDKNGNCTDINIILTNMLNMAGIKAKPVLLSTRDHGHINTKFPMIDDFNYSLVYVKIEEKEYLLDATDQDLPLGMIPVQCINDYGLVMDTAQEKWLLLYNNNDYNIATSVACQYNPEEEKFVAQVSSIYRGYAAYMQRKDFKDDSETFSNDLKHHNVDIIGLDSIDQPLKVYFEVPYDIESLGENIYLSADIFGHFHEHPFKSPQRNFPIDYGYHRTYRYTFNLIIPQGYKVEEFPTPETIALEDNSVLFMFQTQASDLNVQLLGIVKISKPIIEAKHYEQLREIYNTILSKYSQKIVLKKVSN